MHLGLTLGLNQARSAGGAQFTSPLDYSPQLWLNAANGPIPGGCRFPSSSPVSYFSIADNPSLSAGDIDFTFCCMVRGFQVAGDRGVAWKGDANTPAGHEWMVWWDNVAQRFKFSVSNGVTATVVTSSFVLPTPARNVWYLLTVWHDSVNNTINIQIDDNPVDSVAHTVGSHDSGKPFEIGRAYTTTAYYANRIARAGFWKNRILTANEKVYLRNDTYGRFATELGVAGTDGSDLLTGLVSYWNMCDNTGEDTPDRVGSNTLDDVSNNTSAAIGPHDMIVPDEMGTVNVLSLLSNQETPYVPIRPPVFSSGDSFIFNGVIGEKVSTIEFGYANLLSNQQNHTLSFWYNGTTLSGAANAGVFAATGAGALYSVTIGLSTLTWRCDTTRTYNLAAPLLGWNHLCFVKTGAGDSGNFYLNGVLQAVSSGTIGSTPTSILASANIQFANTTSSQYAYIFNPRIYSTVSLNQSQVNQLLAGDEVTGVDPTVSYMFDGKQHPTGTPLLDDRIAAWRSLGNNLLMQCPTFTAKPQYKPTGINGNPAIRFDGTSDTIWLSPPDEIFTTDEVVIFCTYNQANKAYAPLFEMHTGHPGEAGVDYFLLTTGWDGVDSYIDLIVSILGVIMELKSSVELEANTTYLIRVQTDGTAWSLFINGVAVPFTVVAGPNDGRWRSALPATKPLIKIGNHPLDGMIQNVLILNQPTETQIANIEQYFANEAGIVLP